MSSGVCEAIKYADEVVVFDQESKDYTFDDEILKVYCPAKKIGGKRECDSNGLKVSSAFIAMLEYFKSTDDYEDNLKNDKLAEYAILWLNYKIKQNKNILFGVNDIYDMTTRNDWFTEHREYIDKKKDIMTIYYSYLNKLYTLLKEICNTITKCNESPSKEECVEYANKCVKLYQEYAKTGPTHHEYCNPYCHILSNLKDDYEKFRKKYNENKENKLPEFTMPNGVESCKSLCRKKEQKPKAEDQVTEQQESVISTENILSDQPSPEVSDSQEGQLDEPDSITLSSVTSTSINNGNKLPYIAVPFVLIPIILGISYKYLIHGRGKKVKKKKNEKKIINLCEEK
ncbi:CIR protein [Plasmodium chabaudi adami]|uniref:CIR protein n=1 Tax=Plasmodium chabaudi adami TaxID=5826 RepID=A0A1D3L8D2_PLACE|nr:CIR protein [Plasmodium chabaudi adami]